MTGRGKENETQVPEEEVWFRLTQKRQSSDVWAEHPDGQNLRYNTEEDFNRLVYTVTNSRNPSAALTFAEGFLSYPFDKDKPGFDVGYGLKTGQGWHKFGSVQLYITLLDALPNGHCFQSRNSETMKFKNEFGMTVVMANKDLATAMMSVLVKGWDETHKPYPIPILEDVDKDEFVSDSYALGLAMSSYKWGELAYMETGFWFGLARVTAPLTRHMINTDAQEAIERKMLQSLPEDVDRDQIISRFRKISPLRRS